MIELKPSEIYQIIDNMINEENNMVTIKELCDIACVSRSGYYYWKSTTIIRNNREIVDYDNFMLVLEAFNYRGYAKGARGIHMRLLKMGVVMNLKKIRRLMKKYGLKSPIRKANPYRRMAKAMKTNNHASNILERNFEAFGPRSILLTDISYIPYNESFAYLSVVMDAYTKEVLSYVLSPSLEIDFVLETVNKLIKTHGDELKSDALIHSD